MAGYHISSHDKFALETNYISCWSSWADHAACRGIWEIHTKLFGELERGRDQ